jgi:formylglycine-generating enzyme required for sulfatase activity
MGNGPFTNSIGIKFVRIAPGEFTMGSPGNDASKLADYAWYEANSDDKTHLVGSKQPNAWGLYDVHGNVWQWCSSWYGDYPNGELSDPPGSDQGSWRVIKGGSWNAGPHESRIAFRGGRYDPHHWSSNLGLRVVLEIP